MQLVLFCRYTYIIVLVFWENSKELLQKGNKLSRHGAQLMDIAIRVDITEASTDRIVDKEQIGKLIPGTVIQSQRLVTLDPIRANLHQGAILGAAPGPTIEPYHGSLAVRNVIVLEVPEEQVAIVLWNDLDVTAGRGPISR